MSVLWEASENFKPPRTAFLDFPLGCPAGKPHETAQQREILRAALGRAPSYAADDWHMDTLPFQWEAGGKRSWEAEVYDLYRGGGITTVLAHHRAHQAQGDSLAGHEQEFVIKCNC